MKSRIIVFLLVVFLSLSMIGCDSGLKFVEIDITSFPNNIVYKLNEHSLLDLTGGIIRLTTKSGETVTYSMNDQKEFTISSDVKFDQLGVYEVIITRFEGLSCKFAVQVIP